MITEQNVAEMANLLQNIEDVDTDILIYGDNDNEMEFLKIDRKRAVKNFQEYLKRRNYFK